MALTNEEIKSYSISSAAGHFLCDSDDLTPYEQYVLMVNALECDYNCAIPDSVCIWESFESRDASFLVEEIENLADSYEKMMLLARDGSGEFNVSNTILKAGGNC